MEEIKLEVSYKDRIDKYIGDNSSLSRSDAKKLIEQKSVYVNDTLIRKPHFIVDCKNTIFITKTIEKEIKALPEKIFLKIVYEDEDLVIINKESGMVVHPAPGNPNKTLVNALLYHFNNNLSNINDQTRPGIVHRLDKDTSGLLIVAKNNEAHVNLANQLKEHKIKRTYYAIVQKPFENKKIKINLPIARDTKHRKKMTISKVNGKKAITHVTVEKNLTKYAFIKCELETGRTHQIRVHLSYIKHPIYGDPLYGTKVDKYNQRLHAAQLEFVHPKTKKLMVFNSPLPEELKIENFE